MDRALFSLVTPAAVRLRFCRAPGELLKAEVRCVETGEIACTETLPNVKAWLDTFGYVWKVGSNGVWVRQ